MPSRRDIFVNGNIYHIFNKTIDHREAFKITELANLFIDLCYYYCSTQAILRHSLFKKLPEQLKTKIAESISNRKTHKVEILSYCLMPNHFHLLVKQKKNAGIVTFMATMLNSFTRFYNVLYERKGPVFLPQFRSRRMVTDEQLLHVSRYIHLNPYSSGLLADKNKLIDYRFCSFFEYLTEEHLCNTSIVLAHFNNKKNLYNNFVLSQADYQRTLEACKHTDTWI